MSSDRSVVKKGKDCVAVAKNALDDIGSGREEMALTKLSVLQKDGSFLADKAKQLAERLEAVDKHYQSKDAELLHQIENLSRDESKLKSDKTKAEAELADQQNLLTDNRNILSSAEDSLRDAEHERKKAEDKEKSTQVLSTVGGAVLGAFTGGAGLFVGALAGAGIGATINKLRDAEKNAMAEVQRCKSALNNANAKVKASKGEISNIQSQIKNLAQKIKDKEQQSHQLRKKGDKIKGMVVIVKQSVEFWLLFKQISEHGIDRTELLQKIATRATEKGDYRALQSQSSQRIANTFIEAWEEMETTVEHGGSNHILEIEYKCSRCHLQHTALPYVNGSTALVCLECYSKYALQN